MTEKRRLLPICIFALVLSVYFAVRLWSQVPTHVPAFHEGRFNSEGVTNGALAYRKMMQHDRFQHVRLRRGGWLISIFLWPIKPNDAETKTAGKFIAIAINAFQELKKDRQICSSFVYRSLSSNQSIVRIVDVAADALLEGKQSIDDDALSVILASYTHNFSCGRPVPNSAAIKMLRQNRTPEHRKMFDEVFGEGSSTRVLDQ